MSNWTPEQHADARVWANERGAKSRALAGALDEIERLQKENRQELACSAPEEATGTYEWMCASCAESRCSRRYAEGVI